MSIERRMIAARKALNDATTHDQVLSVANRCSELIKECSADEAVTLSAWIQQAEERTSVKNL